LSIVISPEFIIFISLAPPPTYPSLVCTFLFFAFLKLGIEYVGRQELQTIANTPVRTRGKYFSPFTQTQNSTSSYLIAEPNHDDSAK